MKHVALALVIALGLSWSATTVEAHGPYGWGPRPAIGFYYNPVVPAPYYYPPPPVPRAYGYWAPPPPPPPVYAPAPAIGLWFGS
jgi:hypothetical protein